MASSNVQCQENERLLNAFAEAVRELLMFHEQHLIALSAGEQDAERYELLIHVAGEKRQAAKYGYLSHIEEHGCERSPQDAPTELCAIRAQEHDGRPERRKQYGAYGVETRTAPGSTKKPRLLLADKNGLVLEGLKRILESEFELAGLAENGRELLRLAQEQKPDVILTDVSIPLLNGIDAAKQLRKTSPQVKVIFVTEHADSEYVVEALRAGASGYLLKRSTAPELFKAIHEALKGGCHVTPLVVGAALRPLVGAATKASIALTSRQREVLQLVAEGHSLKEIAAILQISTKTVEFHKGELMERLGIHTTAELTRYAIKHGLTE